MKAPAERAQDGSRGFGAHLSPLAVFSRSLANRRLRPTRLTAPTAPTISRMLPTWNDQNRACQHGTSTEV